MIYRRKTYKVLPDQVAPFTAFFEEYLLPNQLKHGATLVGRFVSEAQDEIVAIWAYPSYEEYERIEAAVRNDEMHSRAQSRRKELGQLFLESRQDFLQATGDYAPPRQIVSACGSFTNDKGETLLVRTNWRSDTWEMPGGQVEEGEAPHLAVEREVREETGLEVKVTAATGVYCNVQRGIICIVFKGIVIGGEIRTSDEAVEVAFVQVTPENIGQYMTRPHFRSRLLDAMKSTGVPYEAFQAKPYTLLQRFE